MDKLWLIIKREYLTRVKRRSFIIATLLTPLAFAVFFVVVGLIFQYESDEYHEKSQLATGRPGYTSYSSDYPVLYPYFGRVANEIAKIKPGARILEIGAASGYFLDQARRAGMRPEGIEPSKACQRIIRDELRLLRLNEFRLRLVRRFVGYRSEDGQSEERDCDE